MITVLLRIIALSICSIFLPFVGLGQTYQVSTLSGGIFRDGSAAEAKFYSPYGTAVDAAGNVYVADSKNHRIRKISPNGLVTTLAGTTTQGYADGIGTNASFRFPTGVAVDGAGNVYVADCENHCIRRINPAGMVTTFAGLGTVEGNNNGTGSDARFRFPRGIAIDGASNLYVTEWAIMRIRKISPNGVVTTLAGSGTVGYADGLGTAASFSLPNGIAADANGNVYVADEGNDRIRKISPLGMVTTFAGGLTGFANGSGSNARFWKPTGLAVDIAGNVYVADYANHSIRKISSIGVVTTIAGSGIIGSTNGTRDTSSFNFPRGVAVDGVGYLYVADELNHCIRKVSPAGAVTNFAGIADPERFDRATGVAIDNSGNLYMTDANNHLVRKISPAGVITTLAGSGARGNTDGTGTNASFSYPNGIALDRNGNVYVSDYSNNCIRKISSEGVVTTLAGSSVQGNTDGMGINASFRYPSGLSLDSMGNVYVADYGNHCIRKVSPEGMTTTIAGSGLRGFADGIGSNARFNYPDDVAIDRSGNIYVVDGSNNRIRKIGPDGVVSTVAGSALPGFADGTGTSASFNYPSGIALDDAGFLYIADKNNGRIRKISPSGVVTTLAGSGAVGSSEGIGSAASFYFPNDLEVTGSGIIYVADEYNHAIRKLTPSCNTPPIPTITGSSTYCNGGYTILTSSSITGNLWSTGDNTRSITVRLADRYSVRSIVETCTSANSETIIVSQITLNRPQVSVSTNNLIAGDSTILTIVNPNTGSEYVWSNGAIGTRIVIRTSDTFTVQERLSGCLSEPSLPIVITSNKKSIATKFQVFPNPATNKVTVNTSGTGTLEILNNLGQIIITQLATATNEINISKLAQGIYTIRFNGASQKLVVK